MHSVQHYQTQPSRTRRDFSQKKSERTRPAQQVAYWTAVDGSNEPAQFLLPSPATPTKKAALVQTGGSDLETRTNTPGKRIKFLRNGRRAGIESNAKLAGPDSGTYHLPVTGGPGGRATIA